MAARPIAAGARPIGNSDEVSAALNRAVLAGELSEGVERIADWYGGPDAMKHVYALTDRGEKAVAEVEAEHEDEAATVEQRSP